MLPIFHLNNFKPWAPPHRKPLPPKKSPTSYVSSTQNPRHTKLYHNSLPSTLPPSKHHLPARPPAEVCVPTNAGSQSSSLPSIFQLQPRKIIAPEPLPYSETTEHSTISLKDLAPHISETDISSRCNRQENAGIPTRPPPFRGDSAEDVLLSPSISGSDGSIEEFSRLPEQGHIPIDPVILANDRSSEDIALQLSDPQVDDSLVNSETICPYPDPPTPLYSLPSQYRDSSVGAGGQYDSTRTIDHPHINDSEQLPPSQQDTNPDTSCCNGAREDHHASVSGKSNSAKRKLQQTDEGTGKRSRGPSILPFRESSFTSLRSHFVSLPLDERLQFLSWLFEGALPRCMSDYSLTLSEQGDARAASHSTLPDVIGQAPRGSMEVIESSRKSTKWSQEEETLLLKLKKYEKRPWKEIKRLFSEKYPGRSLGAIQVHWSTTLMRKED